MSAQMVNDVVIRYIYDSFKYFRNLREERYGMVVSNL